MKIFFLKIWVVWRRFRRARYHDPQHLQYASQLEPLMGRANPFACWNERANWIIDIAEWIRRQPKASLLDQAAWRRVKQQRLRFLLDWLDSHRSTRRVVQASIQKTLREAAGPELFTATGLAREPAFFSELWERIVKLVLPTPPAHLDLSILLTSMFPEPADADWLRGLDRKTLSRIWKLCADDAIAHAYRQQIDEALLYLVTMVASVGVSTEFRQRLEPRMSLQVTPFMALRRELENYLSARAFDDAALRSVRMLIAVCQAQTDRIYAHLDEYGVSVGLVYHTERMRAQLARMARLIDLRAASDIAHGNGQVQLLLIDLIATHHERSSVRGLVQRTGSLLARKIVESGAGDGEQFFARDRAGYRVILKAAGVGGVIAAFAALVQLALANAGLARFFEGVFVSVTFVASFMLISALGGVLATKQPAATASALASRMSVLATVDGVRVLLREITAMLRSQAAAIFGNLLGVVPAVLALALVVGMFSSAPVQRSHEAFASLHALSIVGVTPLFAAITGVLLWLSSLVAGLAENWFALRRLREALTHHRRLIQILGPARAERLARWLERHISGIAGNVALGVLLGMAPVASQFFGLTLEVRHVTLSAAALAAAAGSLGWPVFASPEFWLALCGVGATGLLNVGVAFACALNLSMRARDVPARVRRVVFRAIVRRFTAAPGSFLFPGNPDVVLSLVAPTVIQSASGEEKRSKRGFHG